MNRNCVKKKIFDLKEIRLYRLEHPVRMNVKMGEQTQLKGASILQIERRRGPLPSDNNKNFTYGMPTRFQKII